MLIAILAVVGGLIGLIFGGLPGLFMGVGIIIVFFLVLGLVWGVGSAYYITRKEKK